MQIVNRAKVEAIMALSQIYKARQRVLGFAVLVLEQCIIAKKAQLAGAMVCHEETYGFDLSRPLSAPRSETHAGQLRARALTSDPHASISPFDNTCGDSVTLDISNASL